MSPALWFWIQMAALILYGYLWVFVLADWSVARAWPLWMAEVALDLVFVPFWITMALISARVVEHEAVPVYLAIDLFAALCYLVYAGLNYHNHRKGRWRPSYLGRVVTDLALRKRDERGEDAGG